MFLILRDQKKQQMEMHCKRAKINCPWYSRMRVQCIFTCYEWSNTAIGVSMNEALKKTPCRYHIYIYIWVFPKIMVPPNHPILIGFSIINHPFWGTPIFGNIHIYIYLYWRKNPWIQCRPGENASVEGWECKITMHQEVPTISQMLHGTGIFTKPFPLECGHSSPNVGK